MATCYLQHKDNNVAGRLALITGASGGIGLVCTQALAAEGCDVAIHYGANKAKAEAIAADLSSKYPQQLFRIFSADLSSREATRGLVPTVLADAEIVKKGHKAISILVANAGLGRRIRDVAEIGEDDWDEMMEVNARSQFVVTKAALAGMRAQKWGRVVMVGSIASRGSGLNGCHYAASKGALSSMGQNLAGLLAPEGVTVNIVAPAMIGETGMIPTPQGETWKKTDDLDALKATDPGLAIAAGIPVHRLGSPQEVANVLLMFVKSGYITGQEVLMAGGLK
ncbi:3-ketoacyl-acyl carrier protein [Ophiostoma piceae UAMH 11346]|uniref:3-ketoacyl-acyl carrier protein n=1 Tax=Ophiostoma piceae (strain UAMH 11346) TaxID=1262450 RepID=S3C2B1_OPHP1|nr:3-ketoacyl-acyl carrier protein [Ophiostoma piceae UAMH 11346]